MSTNITTNPSYFRYASLVCGVSILPVAVLGILGNCISASVFRHQRNAAASTYSLFPSPSPKESRSSINVLLIGLTAIDTLLLILATPLFSTIAVYNFSPETSQHLLTPIAYLTVYTYPPCMMTQAASVWTMVLISLERYAAICRPLSTRAFGSVGKTKKAFVGVVLAAVLYNACRFGEYRLNRFGNGTEPVLRDDDTYMNVYMNWSYFTLVFALPFFVLLFVNSLITRTIVKARRQRRVIVVSQHNRREQRTALMMAAVVLAYMFCNVPALILNGWEAVGGREGASRATTWLLDSELFSFLSDLNNLLIEAHSGLTFVVYFRFSGHFRGFVYHQFRFLCYLRYGTLKLGSRWGQRPTEMLVEKSRNLTMLLAGDECREEALNARYRRRSSMSAGRGSTSLLEQQYRLAHNRSIIPPRRRVPMRKSTYVAVARGSLESHLDPFHM